MNLSPATHNAVCRLMHNEWHPSAKVWRVMFDVPRLAQLVNLPMEEAYILGAALHARHGMTALRSEELRAKAEKREPDARLVNEVRRRLEDVGRAIKEHQEREEVTEVQGSAA